MAVNAVVAAEMFYLINSRSILASVVNLGAALGLASACAWTASPGCSRCWCRDRPARDPLRALLPGARDPFGRFHALLLVFMGAMTGVALSDNLLLTVVFWETTSLASFLLIGYWSDRATPGAGARMALVVTGLGGLALLAGAILLAQIAGTFTISELNGLGDAIRAHPHYDIALVLILLGAFTKSAQWPFHFWLPNAMAAPTPVSAYLHSATMVKAGIFLLARLYPALAGSDTWFWIVGGTGLATFVFGAWAARCSATISRACWPTRPSATSDSSRCCSGVEPARGRRCRLPPHQPRDLQGVAVHGRRHRRPRDRHPRPPAPRRPLEADARDRPARADGCRRDGRRAFPERLPLEGDAVRRDARAARRRIRPLDRPASRRPPACSASRTRRASSTTSSSTARRAPATARPTSRRAGCAFPSSCSCSAASLVGIAPALTIGPLLRVASGAVLGGPVPQFDLALWHGFNAPLAMSLVALAGGYLMYLFLYKRHECATASR
jgi:multicomponent K+:H+ antiporter subunit A